MAILTDKHFFIKAKVNYQLPVLTLTEQTLQRKEGKLSSTGALIINTGEFTGRSPADKFIVKDTLTIQTVDWNKFNNPISETSFFLLRDEILVYLNQQDQVWIRDAYACASPAHRIKLRIVNENPSANHFAANMFIEPTESELKNFEPEWLILHAPGFKAAPNVHGTRQGNFTIVSFTQKTILIGGTAYTGEIKKSVFTILNFILPLNKNILSMHCSANEGTDGDTALFFGLSGTGKTTLSSDPSRKLIGDDEHAWHDTGIFNCEGGCYAKAINLSEEKEPAIFSAIRPGALVENTCFIEGTNEIDFESRLITENTRVSYPLNFIPDTKSPAVSGIPKNIFFLTCDAYGVFPPISRLTHDQAMYYFINGYTAKVAGTETDIKEPQLTFSACFGAPFLPLHPHYYADLLKNKLEKYDSSVWMINTGWTGGSYGKGKRINLAHTRAMIAAVLNGQMETVSYKLHAAFGILIPDSCPGVPSVILNPADTWVNEHEYNVAAENLAEKFQENFRQYTSVLV